MYAYLPSGCIFSKVGEGALEPVVDLVEAQLTIFGVENGLEKKEEKMASFGAWVPGREVIWN